MRTSNVQRPTSNVEVKSEATNPLFPVAVLTALCTFVLIFIGGMVTSKHAGMSVPDWPNSYGYNMFLFPPSKWIGGIRFEHEHRLMGTVVGFCATVLTLIAWGPGRSKRGRWWIVGIFAGLSLANIAGTSVMAARPAKFHISGDAAKVSHVVSQGVVTEVGMAITALLAFVSRRREPRRWVRWLCTAVLIAICLQGLLGGMRVDLMNLTLAMVHGCFAQASFCLIVLSVIVTGKWWQQAPDFSGQRRGRILVWLAVTCVVVVYSQLIIGAVMRHLQAGLAIPDLPLAYGKWLPPTTADQLREVNHFRVWKLDMDPVSLKQVWLAFAHRIGAVVVSTLLVSLVSLILVRHRDRRDLVLPASVLLLLLGTQITLGFLTVYWKKPADVASSHVACGALVLVTTFLIAVRGMRLYLSRAPSNQSRVAEATAAGVVEFV